MNKNAEKMLLKLKQLNHNSSDIKTRSLIINNTKVIYAFIEGVCSDDKISNFVVRSMTFDSKQNKSSFFTNFFEHLKDNIGKTIQVNLFKPIDGDKIYIGNLIDFDKDYIIIKNDNEIKIDRKNIAQIKTVYNW